MINFTEKLSESTRRRRLGEGGWSPQLSLPILDPQRLGMSIIHVPRMLRLEQNNPRRITRSAQRVSVHSVFEFGPITDLRNAGTQRLNLSRQLRGNFIIRI